MKEQNITIKFSIGDVVFYPRPIRSGTIVCPKCHNNPVIFNGDAAYSCQHCSGIGHVDDTKYIVHHSKIKALNITFKQYYLGYNLEIKQYEDYEVGEINSREAAWTGYFRDFELFSTREECQKVTDELNKRR
jgi:hypothetical protein